MRLLKGHFFGGVQHLIFKILLRYPQISFQNMVNLFDLGIVLGSGLSAFARPFAVAQVKFQTYLELARFDVLFTQIQVAGTDCI